MREVCRAADTKLRRGVAMRVLPAAFTEDKERLARFEGEAQRLAHLPHPSLASIRLSRLVHSPFGRRRFVLDAPTYEEKRCPNCRSTRAE